METGSHAGSSGMADIAANSTPMCWPMSGTCELSTVAGASRWIRRRTALKRGRSVAAVHGAIARLNTSKLSRKAGPSSGPTAGGPSSNDRRFSGRELEALEAVQRFFNLPLAQAAEAIGEPGPLLQQELAPLAIGLEIDDRDELVAGEHRLGEVTEPPLLLGNVSFEAVLVAEKKLQPLTRMDEWVEGRKHMDLLPGELGRGFERFGPRPVLQVSGAVELHGHELRTTHSGFDQPPHGGFASGIEVAGRIEAHEAL